jgi:hypothetical protein
LVADVFGSHAASTELITPVFARHDLRLRIAASPALVRIIANGSKDDFALRRASSGRNKEEHNQPSPHGGKAIAVLSKEPQP